jgi:hypothetical protein
LSMFRIVHIGYGVTQLLMHPVAGALSLGAKRSPPSSAEDKKTWMCAYTPPIHLRGVVLHEFNTGTPQHLPSLGNAVRIGTLRAMSVSMSVSVS